MQNALTHLLGCLKLLLRPSKITFRGPTTGSVFYSSEQKRLEINSQHLQTLIIMGEHALKSHDDLEESVVALGLDPSLSMDIAPEVRRAYAYQSAAGVTLICEAIKRNTYKEFWFEHHDDILGVKHNGKFRRDALTISGSVETGNVFKLCMELDSLGIDGRRQDIEADSGMDVNNGRKKDHSI